MTVPIIKLNNGAEIPQFGFGVFQIDPKDTAEAVTTALQAGYRHIDTAQMYGNEAEVGEGIHASGIDPAEIWVTSKLNNNKHSYDAALRGVDETLGALNLKKLDLFLIHWPLPTIKEDFVDTWRALEQAYNDGKIRSIGVSNFQAAHLDRLMKETSIVPVVNQIELHPYFTQEVMQRTNETYGIVTEAWSPIAQGAVLDDGVLKAIAKKYDKTVAQVTLRWHIELGNIVFPKSSTPERIKENIDIFDFSLTDEEVQQINGLNRDERTGPDPDTFDMVPK